jgi:hypothetical protein
MIEPRLVYIAAWGRSGSTILGNILGALPGVFDAGELRHFWGRSGRSDRTCGCGATLADCPFWREVRAGVLADADLPTDDLEEIHGWQREAIRTRRTRRVIDASSAADLPSVPFGAYIESLRCLYRAIARVSGAEIIVDSSKKTGYGALVRHALNSTPVFVHLVRDPRATAFSWQRVRSSSPADAREMPRHSAFASSVNWVVCNLGGERLRRRGGDAALRIRYEDLVRSPRDVFRELAALIGRDGLDAPFVDERTVELPSNHTFAGNPSRFRHGRVALVGDDEWMRGQRRSDRLVCDLVTLPLLHRYGYRLRVR